MISDRHLVEMLFYYTACQTEMTECGKVRSAVIFRRRARQVGSLIMERVGNGTWVG